MKRLTILLMVLALMAAFGLAGATDIKDDMVFKGAVDISGGTLDLGCTDAQILVSDSIDLACKSVSGDVSITNAGAATLAANSVDASQLNYEVLTINVASGGTYGNAVSTLTSPVIIGAYGFANMDSGEISNKVIVNATDANSIDLWTAGATDSATQFKVIVVE